jgi:hypothetical protein
MAKSGIDWLKERKRDVSKLGESAASFLDDVFEGIYQIEKPVVSACWDRLHHIEITIPGVLATFDSDTLTRLVVFAYDHGLRVEIEGAAFGYLKIRISDGEKQPQLDGHIEIIRDKEIKNGI